VLGFLFLGAAPLSCPDAGDADDNGVLEITDAVATLAYLFSGGGPPALPGPDICGFDPTVDDAGPCDSTGCR
jgi:hypothetical protein